MTVVTRNVSAAHATPAMPSADQRSEGQLVVRMLEAQGVTYVFGVPGAKIDTVYDALVDSKIKTVVTRHEQNAAFIAGGIGRMTGKAGVELVSVPIDYWENIRVFITELRAHASKSGEMPRLSTCWRSDSDVPRLSVH